ncbi:MAG: serine/threonine-protein kinase, partial [Myxococcota bacterium]
MRDNAQIIPGYTLLERLGQGGQGDVFLARHDHGGATMVALKLLRDMRLEDRAALRREVELLRQIDHPGVVQVLHAELDHTPPWYTMELIQGPTLRHMLARLHPQQQQASGHWWTAHLEHDTHPSPKPSPHTGIATQEPSSPPPPPAHDPMPLPDRDTQLGLLRKLALNLAALHAQGLVHRDLKPENVILRDGNPLQPVLVDFGLATLSEDGGGRARLAPSIHKAGTLAYMAPEQLRGDLVDARADLYALGCLLFELWTGELPWANGDALRRTGVASPAQMQMLFPEGEPELMTLCRRLLDPNPKSRLSYAVDAVAQLNAVQGQPPAPNVPPSDLYLYPPPFVGRDRLLDALVGFGQTALERHRHEAILIAGAKGIGKTRIALEMARLFRRMSLTLDVIEGRCTEPLLPLEGLR